MDTGSNGHSDLLTPLEQQIVDLVEELSAAVAELCGDDDLEFPLAEFDQRLLLEHAQIISRYVLAQAAARAYPGRYRLLGRVVDQSGEQRGHGADHSDGSEGVHKYHAHDHHDDDRQHDVADSGAVGEFHVADPSVAREAHRQGRAIIGEHPWEHGHDHEDLHHHADEWEWEPIDKGSQA